MPRTGSGTGDAAPPYREKDLHQDASENTPLIDSEASHLLGNSLDVVHDPKATVFSSSANLMNTILGTGMLAMAYAISLFGLYPGIILLTLAAIASAFGLHLLAVCAAQVGRSSSFFSVAALATGVDGKSKAVGWKQKYIPVIIDVAIAIKCFGVSLSYLVVIGDFMPQVMIALLRPEQCSWLFERSVWISFFMIVLGPLTFLKKLDAFKFTSYIALASVIYLLFVVFYYTARDGIDYPPPGFSNAKFEFPGSLKKLPIFVFAFTCHQNIFSIYNELKNNKPSNMNTIINVSISVCFTIYLVLGTLGYISFGSTILNNIVNMYYKKDIIVIVAKFAITILVSFSYPLQLHPCRRSVDKVVTLGSPSEKWATWRYWIITVVLIASTWGIALANPPLDLILSVVGSIGSTTICYTLPGIFYVLLSRRQGWPMKRIAALILFIVGLLIMIVCLVANFIEVGASNPVTCAKAFEDYFGYPPPSNNATNEFNPEL